jgi:hypothetical protein
MKNQFSMTKLFDYLKNSDIIITILLNPSRWSFYFDYSTHSDQDPGLVLDLIVKLGFIKFYMFIDDGRW